MIVKCYTLSAIEGLEGNFDLRLVTFIFIYSIFNILYSVYSRIIAL